MVVIGVVLVLLAGTVGLVVALSNAGADHLAQAQLFGYSATLSLGRLFLLGAIVGLVGGLGLSLMLSALARAGRRRRARRVSAREASGASELEARLARTERERDEARAELQSRQPAPPQVVPVHPTHAAAPQPAAGLPPAETPPPPPPVSAGRPPLGEPYPSEPAPAGRGLRARLGLGRDAETPRTPTAR